MIKGSKLIGAQFLGMTQNNLPLINFTPTGAEVDGEGGLRFQTLDMYGRSVRTYTWYQGYDDESGENYAGWFDETPGDEGDDFVDGTITIPMGQAVWVNGGDSKNSTLTSTGKFSFSDISVKLRKGSMGVANPFPQIIKVMNTMIVGENMDGEGGIRFQTLDMYGRSVRTYTWYAGYDDESGENYAGWFDETPGDEGDDFIDDSIEILPGEGIWVLGTDDEELFFYFPCPVAVE